MQYSITFNSELQILELTIQGDFSVADAKPLLQDAIEEVKAHNCFRILVDFRDAKLKFSVSEIYNAPKFFAGVAAATSTVQISTIKRALVTETRENDYTFFETVLFNRGHSMKLFQDIDEAKEWLLK